MAMKHTDRSRVSFRDALNRSIAMKLMNRPFSPTVSLGTTLAFTLALLVLGMVPAKGRPAIRSSFFDSVYPGAKGTRLDTLPSNSGHCGVCHYDFNGGGTRNPYGLAIQNSGFALNKEPGISDAILSVATNDWDGDSFGSGFEITNRVTYPNTPTFPGLAAANTNLVLNVALAEIAGYLKPTIGGDATPPLVQVLTPNGGQVFMANRATNITWSASDANGVASINIYVSLNNGATYQQIARQLGNSGTFSWVPADRPTTQARIKVAATDTYGNTTNDVSNAAFTIVSPPFSNPHGVATTLRDFDLPGTQPFEHGPDLEASAGCATCHGGFDTNREPYYNWQGSMMANAALDPLFLANMAIANQDAANSGDLCLRCHLPRGWLAGRSVPTDGSRMEAADRDGVNCALCHRMVNPTYAAGVSPTNDVPLLTSLSFPGTNYGNGMFVIDSTGLRRGPYSDASAGHASLGSPFHRTAQFCGTCHDVSNPAFTKDGAGVYQPNTFDAASSTFSPHFIAPVERTFSEWLASTYNTTNGVHAPQFAGNRADGRVSTCQHCHMQSVSGYACDTNSNPGVPLRADMGLHDMTGGSTWVPALLTNLFPGEVSPAAIQAGIVRANSMLQRAASIRVSDAANGIKVTVTNECGHKLPTGYPEGRRVWINVKFYDEGTNLLAESGAYNPSSGVLVRDGDAKVYEVHPGIGTNISGLLGLEPDASLHFVLNNTIYEDNRIPPRGFANGAFAAFGGEPVGYGYADGQYWDDSLYSPPSGTVRAEVKLYYQSTSKEFIEFLRDENRSTTHGQTMFNLWNDNGKCPPTLMAEATWLLAFELQHVQFNVQGALEFRFLSRPGTTYKIEYTDDLGGTPVWHEFSQAGTLLATGTDSLFKDDFTAGTSGGPSTTGARFYRFSYTTP
jgi:hypothetical protein